MTKNLKLWIASLTLVAIGLTAYFFWQAYGQDAGEDRYRLQSVDRGSIVQTVTANGTINPVVLVNVGTQVSGTIKKLHVDFNSHVKEGQILAELDPRLLQAQLDQDLANLAAAKANLKLQEANWARQQSLIEREYISTADMDVATQTRDAALAQVKLYEAQIRRSQTNLEYSRVRSPVSGVVISRQVDIGQTVTASFQTPVLFQIAKDLKQMQIDTHISEAHVGGIVVGQEVRFYVDAYPDQPFTGRVKQVRLNPTIQQNVVTYNVVVSIDNSEEKLVPGMTAYTNIIIDQRQEVTRLPSAALRFVPSTHDTGKANNPSSPPTTGSTVYRLNKGQPVAVPVTLGITDNRYTELVQGDLKAGDQLIIGLKVVTTPTSNSNFRVRMY